MISKALQGTLTFFIFAAAVSCDLSQVECADLVKSFPGFECAPEGVLGRGTFGVAFLVHSPTQQAVLKVSEYHSESSDKEVGLLKKLSHANVLKLLGSAVQGSFHLLLTSYGANKDLQSYLATHPNAFPTVKDKLQLVSGIVAGLQHIHEVGIVHTDLKPSNVVLGPDLQPAIIDFNLATQFNSKDVFKGTFEFASPKLMKYPEDPEHKFMYGPSDDIYSLGVLMYWLFHDGHVPFEAKDRHGFNVLHKVGLYSIRAGIPLRVAQAIHICLRRPHTERASLDQLAHYLGQISQDSEEIFLKTQLTLDINRSFPSNMWGAGHRYMGFWAEFSEMFFILSLAFVLIPLTVYCLKRKFDGHQAAHAQANQPLHAPQAPPLPPAEPLAVVA